MSRNSLPKIGKDKVKIPIIGAKRKKPKKKKVKVWTCGNCGHKEQINPDCQLKELNFKKFDNRTSKITCPKCGSYTIQRHGGNFKVGQFLVVKARIKKV